MSEYSKKVRCPKCKKVAEYFFTVDKATGGFLKIVPQHFFFWILIFLVWFSSIKTLFYTFLGSLIFAGFHYLTPIIIKIIKIFYPKSYLGIPRPYTFLFICKKCGKKFELTITIPLPGHEVYEVKQF